MLQSPLRHKFTVEELYRLQELLQPEQRMELVCGEIIDMSPINPPHATCVRKLIRFFQEHLAIEKYVYDVQNPLKLSDDSLLQPDLVISHLRPGLLENEHIKAEDVAVLMEVADSSYRYDSEDKYALYASAGIPVYVIINLNQRQAEVYTKPEGNQYTLKQIATEQFTMLDILITLDDILPKA
ncbi:Uma2 family endonuclease [Catalinimonas sp. 4WD22]|uniref:Uma2 family endonuclease n=1 Tax=Catalinimonas locisalis TaxID=3133978 RepID=UPI003101199C